MKTKHKDTQTFRWVVGISPDYVSWQRNPQSWIGKPQKYWVGVRRLGEMEYGYEPWAHYDRYQDALKVWEAAE